MDAKEVFLQSETTQLGWFFILCLNAFVLAFPNITDFCLFSSSLRQTQK